MNRLLSVVAIVAAVALAAVSFVDGFSLVFMTSDYYKRAARGPKRNAAFYEEAAKKAAKKDSEVLRRQIARQAANRRSRGTIEEQQNYLVGVLKAEQAAVAEKLTPKEMQAEKKRLLEAKILAAAVAKEQRIKKIAEQKLANKAKREEKTKKVLAMKAEKMKIVQELKSDKLKALNEKALSGDKKAAAALAREKKALEAKAEKQKKRDEKKAAQAAAKAEKRKKKEEKKAAAAAAKEEKQRKRILAKSTLAKKVADKQKKKNGKNDNSSGDGPSPGKGPEVDDTATIEANRVMIERIMLKKKVQKVKQLEAAQVAQVDDTEGIFAPAVVLTKEVMGVKNLNTLRARVIKEHTEIIGKFTDTADTAFGDTVLKLLFDLADKDGNGTIDEVELQRAFNAIGCGFIPEKTIDGMFKRADKDGSCGLDYEEWCKAAPKSLKTALVKLAKKVRTNQCRSPLANPWYPLLAVFVDQLFSHSSSILSFFVCLFSSERTRIRLFGLNPMQRIR